MHKQLKTTKIGISEQDIIWDEIADLIDATERLGGTYRQEFKRTSIQQQLHDIIHNSEVPEGKLVHILLYGSVGSGKTTGAFSELTDYLVDFPGASVLGCRRTYNEIDAALLEPWEEFLDKFSIPYKSNRTKMVVRFNNGSVIRLISADKTAKSTSDKADHLGGTQYCGAILDEADNIPEEFAKTVAGRMRQKIGVPRRFIIYICNPPSKDHWLYRWFFERRDPDNPSIHLDPHDPRSRYRVLHMHVSENLEHLPPGYEEDIHMDYADNPMAYKRMVRGEFGPAVKGYPIFNQYFNKTVHVANTSIHKNWNPNAPLQRCWDFGFRRPAVVVFQDDKYFGQIRVYWEKLGYQKLLEDFAEDVTNKCHQMFPDAEWEDFCDPSGNRRTDTSEKSSMDVLREMGLRPKAMRRSVDYGLNVILDQLKSFRGSREGAIPALYFDPQCKLLIEGFEMGYCNEKSKHDGGTWLETANQPIKPVKDGTYEHLMDAFRYGLIFKRKKIGDTGERGHRKGWKTMNKVDDVTRGNVSIGNVVLDYKRRPRNAHGSYGFNKRRTY